jgi:hypothetical protein
MKAFYLVCAVIATCIGCQKSVIPKGSIVFDEVLDSNVNPGQVTKIKIQPYKLEKHKIVSVAEQDKSVSFTIDKYIDKEGGTIDFAGNTNLYLKDDQYFFLGGISDDYKSLSYYTIKPQIGAITIPLKIRPPYKDPSQAVRDSFPYQVEAGVSIGFSAGVKFQKTKFQGTKNVFGRNIHVSSLVPGAYVSLGGSDISKTNTRPAIIFGQKAAVLSKGFYLVYGVNNFSLGASVGWDNAYGINKDKWIFQNKVWYGVVVALNFLK